MIRIGCHRSPRRFARPLGAALLGLLVLDACDREPTGTRAVESRPRAALTLGSAPRIDDGSIIGGDITTEGALAGKLPSTDTVTSSVPAFEIKQKGGGIAGRFEITNASSAAIALDGVTSGSGHALLAWNLGLGRAAAIITSNSSNTLPALEVSSQSLGTSTTAAAANIMANNASATIPAVVISTLGQNTALVVNHKGTSGNLVRFQTAGADKVIFSRTGRGYFYNGVQSSASGATPAAELIMNSGSTTNALLVNHKGSSGNLALFQIAGANKIRFDRNGKGFFNGGTQTGGADLAEAFAVEGDVRTYAPGDVLVISERYDRRVTRSNEPYSTRVVGVYATKPGVLLTEREIEDDLADAVPLGVVGVIPTRVSAENGPIRRGDLLVTARTPGHAMLGTDRSRMLGAMIGKALEEFSGPGTGVIKVLVNVR